MGNIPQGVVKPLSKARAKGNAAQLVDGLRGYKGTTWISSPKCRTIIDRLLSLSLADLQAAGQLIPVWRYALGD